MDGCTSLEMSGDVMRSPWRHVFTNHLGTVQIGYQSLSKEERELIRRRGITIGKAHSIVDGATEAVNNFPSRDREPVGVVVVRGEPAWLVAIESVTPSRLLLNIQFDYVLVGETMRTRNVELGLLQRQHFVLEDHVVIDTVDFDPRIDRPRVFISSHDSQGQS